MEHPILREKAYTVIKQKLLDREIQPGERIREDLLAQEVSMSRTPVREAISQLTMEGFIVSLPRKGLFCANVTREEMLDFLKIREALEVLAVQECVRRVTDEEIGRMETLFNDYERALTSGTRREASELDSRFHKSIAELSRSAKLLRFIGELEDFMRLARAKERPDLTLEERELSIRQHRAILKVIQKRDVARAGEAMRTNILGMKRKLGLDEAAQG
jgi:DNA-binding GntR family transcriptional regulator